MFLKIAPRPVQVSNRLSRLAPRAHRSLAVDGNVLAEGVPRDMANKLEDVTQLALEKILPTDRTDGNILRAQTSAAATAINAQLRADEARLRQKSEGDVLDRLLKAIGKEKKRRKEMEDEKRRRAKEAV